MPIWNKRGRALASYEPSPKERVRPRGSDPCQLVEVADGTRTHDHLDHNQGLYRLSYRHRGLVRIAALAGEAGISRLGRRGPRLDGLLLLLVLPLGELLDHLLVERREVVGLAARDEAVVDDHFLVYPDSAGIADVRLQGRLRKRSPFRRSCRP